MIHYLTPVPARRAEGKVSEIYRQIDREFLLGEPLTLHSPIPDLLAAVWSTFREVFIAGRADRSLKEAVAVAVSRSNRCPFCLDAHAMALRATSSKGKIGGLRDPGFDGIEDPGLRAAAAWAEAVSERGTAPVPAPPVSPDEQAELIGALFWMHYINRMVNLFIGESLIPLSSNRLGIRTLIERIGGRYFRRTFRLGAPSGKSLPFLAAPRNGGPSDLGWAEASPVLTRAFSALVETIEAEAAALPLKVRTWYGEIAEANAELQVGMSRNWLDRPLSELEPALRPAGRLLLLTSRAPYQATASDVEAFRRDYPDERQLLGSCSWAALTAARRIAARAAC